MHTVLPDAVSLQFATATSGCYYKRYAPVRPSLLICVRYYNGHYRYVQITWLYDILAEFVRPDLKCHIWLKVKTVLSFPSFSIDLCQIYEPYNGHNRYVQITRLHNILSDFISLEFAMSTSGCTLKRYSVFLLLLLSAMPVYHELSSYCGPTCRLKVFTKLCAADDISVCNLHISLPLSHSQNTVSCYMWDVHCNTAHMVHISSTSVDGKFPNIMTLRWNDIVLAPTPALYLGCEWSTNVVWHGNSVVEPNTTYRIFHLQQHLPSSSLNLSFMTEMLHSSGKWYGNVCAVCVLPDKSVRPMNESDLIHLRCAFARCVAFRDRHQA